MTGYLRATLFALPGVALAIVGTTHPANLTYATSAHWTVMHVVGLLVFPLVGAALAGLVWGRRDPLAWLVGIAAYLYATAYTALDVIAGVAAGFVTYEAGPGARRPSEVVYLFDVGNQIGEVGVWAFLTASVLVAGDQAWRHRLRGVVPGLLLVLAAVSFLDSHIYPWLGVVTVLLIGLATGWLALLSEPGADSPGQPGSAARVDPQNSRAEGSSIPRRRL